MSAFTSLLRRNKNYRLTWSGQVVSEIGDHFNNIAVFSLVYTTTKSGFLVAAIMLARAVPAIIAGPIAGVVLDRFDRKKTMIASDLVRGVIGMLFILTADGKHNWLLFLLSGLLMFASPFFSAGRASILPSIATKDELHTANSLTQTTQWATTAIGAFLGGTSAETLGYDWAFFFNSLSFLFSAWCIWQLKPQPGESFRVERTAITGDRAARPWHEYAEGLRYMKSVPLVMAIGLVAVGWASGGGAAQILFTLFGEQVFQRGARGIGELWCAAGAGLVFGGIFAHWLSKRVSFDGYKRAVSLCYIAHGGTYIVFALTASYRWALLFIGLSRAAVAVSSVMNTSRLLRTVDNQFRGRVFSTIESMTWGTMMLSMTAAGAASASVSPRVIGVVSGVLSSCTALFWAWANWTGRLPEPRLEGVGDPDDIEVSGEPNV